MDITDIKATYKLSEVSAAYGTIFDKSLAAAIGEPYPGAASIPYTKIILILYKTLLG